MKNISPTYVFLGLCAAVGSVLILVWLGGSSGYFLYHPGLVESFSALLVPTVAILGIAIAYWQARTADQQRKIAHHQKEIAKTRLRLDLFDRRFAVFNVTRNLISSIQTSGVVKPDKVYEYLSGIREAKWLLNDDIDAYLSKTLFRQITELDAIDTEIKELRGTGQSPELTDLVQRRRKLRDWLEQQYDVMDEMFGPYLRFRLVK